MPDNPGVMNLLLTTGTTNTTVASRVPTVTNPSTNQGFISFTAQTPRRIKVIPMMQGANNGTFKTFVLGWEFSQLSGTTTKQWYPTESVEIACTCGTMVGTSEGAGVVAASTLDRFCDTLAVTVGNAGVDVSVLSPTSDRMGSFIVDPLGAQGVEILFESSGKANALWRGVD